MTTTLAHWLPGPTDEACDLLDRFLEWIEERRIVLYGAQEEALLEVFAGKNVILNTPTGSGKSLVAVGAHFRATALGQRSFYTSPIKALVNEKFFALCRDFGPERVGLITGDASVNSDAPIVCCTAEILANLALRGGREAPVDVVIMDEFHYYADRDRGVAWQIPLLTLPQARFLLMSATMPEPQRFVQVLEKLTGEDVAVVRSFERPVPLDFEYRESPLHETVIDLVQAGRAPIYVVNFTQRACAETAQDLLSVDFCTKEEKRAIAEALAGQRLGSPYGKELARLLRHGLAVHHAGLLPRYRLLVEKLTQRGLLKIICGTDTLGVGVNVPLRTVLFTKLCKYDGQKTTLLAARDFHQIAGRAGRKGFDDRGFVVVQAPEHVIENLRIDKKIAEDPSKKRKLQKKKPPDFGYVHWDRSTFERLLTAPPEPLTSRFETSHSMLLNVLQRPTGGCRALARLIAQCHDSDGQKRTHAARARELFRSLLDAGILEITPEGVRAHVDLQEDFSLNHALSLYIIDTLEKIDPESTEHALDVLTLVESVLEHPDVILRKQVDKLKGAAVAEMKAAGVEYDDRMAKLEEIDYPKPKADFIYETFNNFRKRQPWVGENIRPKSIARQMYESLMGFSEYVKEYGLQRSEGVLLRYLTDVYRTLDQTIPQNAKTEAVEDIIEYFGAIVRQADSSLLDEWERLKDPTRPVAAQEQPEDTQHDITRDDRGFLVLVRNAIFELLRTLHAGDYASARELLEATDEAGENWTDLRLQERMMSFVDQNGAMLLDGRARSPQRTRVEERTEATWRISHVLCDAAEHDDWVVELRVDRVASRAEQRPVLQLLRFG